MTTKVPTHVLFKEKMSEDVRKRVEIGPNDTKISGFLGNSSEVRNLLEGAKPDAQCNQVGCENKNTNWRPEKCYCYICGYPIKDSGGDEKRSPFGSQCEHVLACAQFAFLCGMGGDDYQADINEILNTLSLYDNDAVVAFREWRKGIIGADNGDQVEEVQRKEGCSQGKGRAYKWAIQHVL